jgi:excisionase family DNA binding protein
MMLKTKEFAAAVGVSVKTVERYVAAKKIIPLRTPGGHARFTHEDIEQWHDLKEQSRGSRSVEKSTTPTGPSPASPSLGDYLFVQNLLAKRRIVSQRS